MDIAVFGPHLLEVGQLSALAGNRHAHTALLPRLFALLERGIIQFTAAARDKRHRLFLLRSRLELVLEGRAHLAYGRRFHYRCSCSCSCCLRYCSSAQTNSLTRERRL